MSCNYADGLSPYHDKGKLGLAEVSSSYVILDLLHFQLSLIFLCRNSKVQKVLKRR